MVHEGSDKGDIKNGGAMIPLPQPIRPQSVAPTFSLSPAFQCGMNRDEGEFKDGYLTFHIIHDRWDEYT